VRKQELETSKRESDDLRKQISMPTRENILLSEDQHEPYNLPHFTLLNLQHGTVKRNGYSHDFRKSRYGNYRVEFLRRLRLSAGAEVMCKESRLIGRRITEAFYVLLR
jgi:hypothetical protein